LIKSTRFRKRIEGSNKNQINRFKAYFPAVLDEATGEGIVGCVTYSSSEPERESISYVQVEDGCFVSDNVKTNFDFSMTPGFYTVLPYYQQFDGESLDLSFFMASQGLGLEMAFSGDLTPDGLLEAVIGRPIKLAALSKAGIPLGVGFFAD
jgi:hypothetical protein